MTPSRRQKFRSSRTAIQRAKAIVPLASAVSAILAGASVAHAQERTATLDSVIVTAQKREENLQNVPVSIQTLGNEQLEELNISDFNDYARIVPSIAFQTIGPGFARVYMRGVSAGDNGNHSGSQPSVGMYLDEQPITTIQGPLDIHLYDIARVEVLAGPQGTLYGASSQAGTIRIITNKPDPGAFKAGYDLEVNSMSHGGQGYTGEGFINLPLGSAAAIRLVGWAEHSAGYIDNVYGTRSYGVSGTTIDNAARAKKDYNDMDTYGARAALKIDLGDSWTITPTVMGQHQQANGNFATDEAVAELALTHYFPESSDDRWWQAALAVEGKIGNFDLVYAGAYLKRDVDLDQDYTDYSFFYDTAYGGSVVDDNGVVINPSQYVQGRDGYTKVSHELRISSPTDWPAHFVAGLFMQRQVHEIEQRYKIDGIGAQVSIPGWDDTWWLTQQERIDRDYAVFGEVTYEFTDQFSATAGVRYFEAKNTLMGFYGFRSYADDCAGLTPPFHGAPCTNLDKTVEEDGVSPKVNLTYQITDDIMTYATWSRGFRPGGVNRRGTFPPYDADYLNNYELGWKTTWADNRVRFNGAIFLEDWDEFQYSFLGTNGLTNVTNARGAQIYGLESTLEWAVTSNLLLSAGVSYLHSELTDYFCKKLDDNGEQLSSDACMNDPDDGSANFAPKGTELPITPNLKGNLTGRYLFSLGSLDSHLQATFVYTGGSRSALLPADSVFLHDLDSSTTLDLSAGFEVGSVAVELFISNATDERAELYRYAECATDTCGPQPYTVNNQPRTVGLKFGQKF